MLGNFTYHNPTKLHFGKDALDNLEAELAAYGPNIALAYGGGSIKRSGLYDQIIAIANAAGKTVFEIPGVMPNPTVEKLYEGCSIVRDNDVDPDLPQVLLEGAQQGETQRQEHHHQD